MLALFSLVIKHTMELLTEKILEILYYNLNFYYFLILLFILTLILQKTITEGKALQ